MKRNTKDAPLLKGELEGQQPLEELGKVEDLTELGNGEPDWEDDGNYADPDTIIWGDGPAS